MKSITKMMVIAMVLVAALVVAPAAARAVTTNGSTIYVGEENLDLSGLGSSTAADGTLVYYSSISSATSGTIGKTIAVSGATFELTAGDVGSSTGAWYFFDSANVGSITDPTAANGYVLVQNPQVTLGVVLNSALPRLESVDGKSVTRETPIAFRLVNNLNGLATTGAGMRIEVTLPGGGVTTQFGGQTMNNVTVDGTTNVTAPITLTNVEAGTYSAQAKWPSTSDFYGKGFDSNAVTFEVLTKKLAITANKDTVVRGNSFTVTITGESLKAYNLIIRPEGGLAENLYPAIVAGQNGVNTTGMVNPTRNATVTTNAAGTRSVQFNTNTSTDDRQYTIRVEDLTAQSPTYDDVKVRVEQGAVTITASGTGVYYIGEEVTLSGTCTDNDTVFLFLTGPNLNNNGVKLETIAPVVNDNTASFSTADVEADDTWSFKWPTGDIPVSLDSGGYTVYAVSKPLDKSGLSDAKYATTSIQLRSGFITATSSGAVVAKGDDLTLTGTAQGDPASVHVWVFGKNLQLTQESATVEDDGSFEYELDNTDTFTSGQYFVVIQHPMMNKEFDIFASTTPTGWINGTDASGFTPVQISRLQASDAATALITALDSPNIDDTYVKLTFVVEEANIFIDAIGDKAAGSKFTITGTTNLAVGDTLNIQVTSAAFQPTTKSEASGFGSVAGVTTVQQGDGANTWSFEIDGASFKPDQYIVNVESIETDTTATATFNVIEATATTQPTGSVTATPTGTETTPTGTATTAATPTQSPGFGALIALAGLGAVAFLVLRRN
jgi:PGF-CTERM protein